MTAKTAIIIGGTGQIGRAIAQKFIADGWAVAVTHRGERPLPPDLAELGVSTIIHDRNDGSGLRGAVGAGADMLIDTIAYDANHAGQLLQIQQDVGLMVVISTSSVYCDSHGRSLDEARQGGFPDLPQAMHEDHATLSPGDANYSTRKAALEQGLLQHVTIPVTILRPCAIHGPHSVHPREWWFVKRMRDKRPFIPLAYRGESRFHTTSVANIAGLAALVAGKPATRVLNIGDETCLTVLEIGRKIAAHLGYQGRFLLLNDQTYPPHTGATPWSVPAPFMIDSSAAAALGHAPLPYEARLAQEIDWLVDATADGRWRQRFAIFDQYADDPFDYAAEDASRAVGAAGSKVRQ